MSNCLVCFLLRCSFLNSEISTSSKWITSCDARCYTILVLLLPARIGAVEHRRSLCYHNRFNRVLRLGPSQTWRVSVFLETSTHLLTLYPSDSTPPLYHIVSISNPTKPSSRIRDDNKRHWAQLDGRTAKEADKGKESFAPCRLFDLG